jgi:hypothetical protein
MLIDLETREPFSGGAIRSNFIADVAVRAISSNEWQPYAPKSNDLVNPRNDATTTPPSTIERRGDPNAMQNGGSKFTCARTAASAVETRAHARKRKLMFRRRLARLSSRPEQHQMKKRATPKKMRPHLS